ncbi:hypothetical protein M0812_23243 [Anaeramoeba flamelloides]|uniref:Uncharacterized protein n=1 Tax=Anaeramoeba flamelloides TaxID=1746091 RepID=A0AAV7YNM4_9EUKA|nr:hypothetical protein M0812_23243 [Anaeramoeba flamelloides]
MNDTKLCDDVNFWVHCFDWNIFSIQLNKEWHLSNKKTRKRIKEQLGDDRKIRPNQNTNHPDNSQTFGGIIEEKENIIQRKKKRKMNKNKKIKNEKTLQIIKKKTKKEED